MLSDTWSHVPPSLTSTIVVPAHRGTGPGTAAATTPNICPAIFKHSHLLRRHLLAAYDQLLSGVAGQPAVLPALGPVKTRVLGLQVADLQSQQVVTVGDVGATPEVRGSPRGRRVVGRSVDLELVSIRGRRPKDHHVIRREAIPNLDEAPLGCIINVGRKLVGYVLAAVLLISDR
ncbi:hypothetical protein CRUP_020363 [Coryphaenoides rupestris]|nr:hypothetical protein CRUP_020363 [Coryphaenoides rupestris]